MENRSTTLADEAEFFRLGLQVGICTRNDVCAWADALLVKDSEKNDWLVQLHITEENYPIRPETILAAVPGKPDSLTPVLMLLAGCSEALTRNKLDSLRASKEFCSLGQEPELSNVLTMEVEVLKHYLEEAEQGWRAKAEAEQELRLFLKRFDAYRSLLPESFSRAK